MPATNDVRLEVRVRNNLVLSKMESLAITTVAELCRRMDSSQPQLAKVQPSKLGELINMKEPARKEDGTWIPLATRLADFFQCMPEDLFSDPQQWSKLERNRSYAEVAYTEIQQLTARNQEQVTPELALEANQLRLAISGVLNSLTPREERVLRLLFGFDGEEKTLEEIGEFFGVTHSRITQIVVKAMRKLAHPTRSGKILAACGTIEVTRKVYGTSQKTLRPDPDVLKAL